METGIQGRSLVHKGKAVVSPDETLMRVHTGMVSARTCKCFGAF